MRQAVAFVLWCAVLIQACAPSSPTVTEKYGKDALRIKGTMQYEHIEGGCWQFVGDDGVAYELTGPGLTPLHRDGLRAEIIVRPARNAATVCMVGKTVELLEIIKIFD